MTKHDNVKFRSAFLVAAMLSIPVTFPATADTMRLDAGVTSSSGEVTFGTLCRGNNPRCRGSDDSSTDDSTTDTTSGSNPTYYSWMSPEIQDAWSRGFTGQGTVVTSVDDFNSGNRFWGNLGDGRQRLHHGQWVDKQVGMLAPDTSRAQHDFTKGTKVNLVSGRLNAVNLSYGMFAKDGYTSVRWSAQESSIISYAKNGDAVVVKAAGNDSVAVGSPNSDGLLDYLNRDLIGAQSAIFVGALDRNGTTGNLAHLASYSNYAGTNKTVQDQFLTVGVRGDLTGLYGTSFAAPVVSGYAAVLGSKFKDATPTKIANQLLNTARTDTISGYEAAKHGRGEASITRALAPSSIN